MLLSPGSSKHLAVDDEYQNSSNEDTELDPVAENELKPGHQVASPKSKAHGHSDSHYEHVLERLGRLERHVKVRARGSVFLSWCMSRGTSVT